MRRGVYGGAVGYFGFSGNMDTGIAIRTLVIDGRHGLRAGGRRHRRRLGSGARVRGVRQQGARAVPGGRAGGGDVAMLLDDRQLRLVHLQPRPVPRRAGRGRARRSATTRSRSTRSRRCGPSAIVISPGPCTPSEAGISVALIRELAGRIPILGVCLGHQCIGAAFGGRIVRADRIMHGKTSPIHHDGRASSPGCPTRSRRRAITRWSSSARRCPTASRSAAWTDEGEIMGVRHREHPGRGRPVPSGVDPHARGQATCCATSCDAERRTRGAGSTAVDVRHQAHGPSASRAATISPKPEMEAVMRERHGGRRDAGADRRLAGRACA